MDSNMSFGALSHTTVNSLALFIVLLCISAVIGQLLGQKNRWMPQSVIAMLMGLVTGIAILFTTEGRSSRILVFDENLFFIHLLPPIIFNAGFWINKEQFFRNSIAIILFGVIGTLLSFAVVSFGSAQLFKTLDNGSLDMGDFMALGAVFAATDSICTLQVLSQEETPSLCSLVFGEGVVNAATSIVLFKAIQKLDISPVNLTIISQFTRNFVMLFLGSTIMGVMVGLVSAYFIKKLCFGRYSADREIAVMFLMPYLSYIWAQLFDLSGILTVFFCGIVMSRYTWHNITPLSRVSTRHAFATFSYVSEIFIFLYVGMDAIDVEKWNALGKSPGRTSFGVSFALFCLVMLGRAAFVFPLSHIVNRTKRSNHDKIGFKEQIIVWWSGLMRGAVSVALAYNQFTTSGHTQLRGNAILITSTITVVLFTNVVGVVLSKFLIRSLLPPQRHADNIVSSEPWSSQLTSHDQPPLLESLFVPLLESVPYSEAQPEKLDGQENYGFRYYWELFESIFMEPIYGRRDSVPRTDLPPGDDQKQCLY